MSLVVARIAITDVRIAVWSVLALDTIGLILICFVLAQARKARTDLGKELRALRQSLDQAETKWLPKAGLPPRDPAKHGKR